MLTDENINRLIALYGNSVIRMSYIILKDYDLAQDVTQDTFIQVIKKYNTLKNKKSEKAWIMKIAINQCRNQLRSQWFKKIVYFEDDKELKDKTVEMDFIILLSRIKYKRNRINIRKKRSKHSTIIKKGKRTIKRKDGK